MIAQGWSSYGWVGLEGSYKGNKVSSRVLSFVFSDRGLIREKIVKRVKSKV